MLLKSSSTIPVDNSIVIRPCEYIGSFAVEGTNQNQRVEFVRSQLDRFKIVERSQPVLLIISLSGIKVCNVSNKTVYMAHALRRISYATCTLEYKQFAFLAREPQKHSSSQYCHAFITASCQQAEELNNIVGAAFRLSHLRQTACGPSFVNSAGISPNLPLFSALIESTGFSLTSPSISLRVADSTIEVSSARIPTNRTSLPELDSEVVGRQVKRLASPVSQPAVEETQSNVTCNPAAQLINDATPPRFYTNAGSGERGSTVGLPPPPSCFLASCAEVSGDRESPNQQTPTGVTPANLNPKLPPLPPVRCCSFLSQQQQSGGVSAAPQLPSPPPRPLSRSSQPQQSSHNGPPTLPGSSPTYDTMFSTLGSSHPHQQHMSVLPGSGSLELANVYGSGASVTMDSQLESTDSGLGSVSQSGRCYSRPPLDGGLGLSGGGGGGAGPAFSHHVMSTSPTHQRSSAGGSSSSSSVAATPLHTAGSQGQGIYNPALNAAGRRRQTAGLSVVSKDEWYQPLLPREKALDLLLGQEPGAFIIRDSSSHPGCFALSVRVSSQDNPLKISHFLIQQTSAGVKLKNLNKEWPSLESLVVHLTVMPEILPCTLRLVQWIEAGGSGRQSSVLGGSAADDWLAGQTPLIGHSYGGEHPTAADLTINPAFMEQDVGNRPSHSALLGLFADEEDDDYQRLSDFSALMSRLSVR